MKKKFFFIVFFLVLVSCKDTLIGGVEDINFDKSELYFDSNGGKATVTTDYESKMIWGVMQYSDGSNVGIRYNSEIDKSTKMEVVTLDNVIVIQNGRSFDITILPSERVFKWEIDVLGAHSIGKIHIYQNSTK